jgi:hypothetical protein
LVEEGSLPVEAVFVDEEVPVFVVEEVPVFVVEEVPVDAEGLFVDEESLVDDEESLVDDEESDGSADATGGVLAMAKPTPRATASAPTRPMYLAVLGVTHDGFLPSSPAVVDA